MDSLNKTINAGVHGSTGLEFQKHCALYFLFNKYENLKDKKYFICLEHHDDFLFCYQTQEELISSIEAYQAKKSSTQWTLGKDMYEIIKKMIEVGLALKADDIPKVDNYKHELEFITNNSIKLTNGKRKDKVTVNINESNNKIKFVNLHSEISNKIKIEIEKIACKDFDGIDELKNISLCYIDLPKSNQMQKNCLIGEFNRIFGESVQDSKAAIDTLLLLFRDVENTLNQGNVAKLMDKSKRVDSRQINDALEIITTKKMAFELWRDEKKGICNKLGINIAERKNFELDFENSFDRFKDLQQVEHLKILNFVRNRNDIYTFTDEVDCIQTLYNDFQNNISSQLTELNIKAAVYAAYIEVRGML